MIEKIIVPTLDRIPGRRYVNLGALVTMGVPHRLIEYFPARDGQAYVGNGGRAVEEALKEGWKLSPRMAEGCSHWSDARSLKWFCMRWTFTMIFQQIMNMPSNRYYMFLVDDCRLNRPFSEIHLLMKFIGRDCRRLGKSASIIQLDVFDLLDSPRIEREPLPSVPSKVLVRGLSGCGDRALILDNNGGRILYERMCETGGGWNVEGQLWRMAQEEDQSGFYSIASPGFLIGWTNVPDSMLGET